MKDQGEFNRRVMQGVGWGVGMAFWPVLLIGYALKAAADQGEQDKPKTNAEILNHPALADLSPEEKFFVLQEYRSRHRG